MANGFRDLIFPERAITNFIAKSPAGNDSNNGTSANSPKATIIDINAGQQIGSGVYLNQGSGAASTYFIIGDGLVVIKNSQFVAATIDFFTARNITFDNCIFSLVGVNNTARNFIKCKIKNCTGISNYNNGKSALISNTIFTNCSFDTNQGSTIDLNIYINSVLYQNGNAQIKNSYFDQATTLNYTNLTSASSFTYNNFQGVLILEGNSYAIQDQLIGTPQDNGYSEGVNWLTEAQLTTDGYTGTIAGWDTAISTCINRDPKFNNVSLDDFSLQADSPHIGTGESGLNIGGTDIANTVLVSQNGLGTIEVLPQPEIDTTNPSFYFVDLAEDEGYIDIIQRIGTQPIVLENIDPIANLEFDSDITGGSVGNRNVPDSEPLTAAYPRKLITTSTAGDAFTLNVTAHDVVVGEFVRVAGEDREVTAITANTITVGVAFRASVVSGVTFQAGSEIQLAALRPNRLTYQLRVSTQVNRPATDAEWDNNIDPTYNFEGLFSTQEWFNKPGYVIDGTDVFGSGDSEANPAITPDEIACTWYNVRVWLRNNYES